MKQSVFSLATCRWPSILPALGIPENFLSRRHGPCPLCVTNGAVANRRPFRFDDKQGRGTWICTHHGAGDGWQLVKLFHGWDDRTAAAEVEKIIGVCSVTETKTETKDPEKIKANIRKIWQSANRVDIADDYLRSRGLSVSSPVLRGHPALNYTDTETGEMTKHPAMVALVTSPEGKVTTLHRTFILGDGKRDKKLYQVIPDTWLGGCIRLFPEHHGHVALAEGIETALAVHETAMMRAPVWATVTAGGMEAWEPPEGVHAVTICADNDANFTGQKSAFILANKLALRGITVDVRIPPEPGDWLDFLNKDVERLHGPSGFHEFLDSMEKKFNASVVELSIK